MLRLENLSKRYANGVQALNGVTLDIPRGMFGLLGPNGAGKSTLMRTIATLQDADSGSIRFGDINVLENKHEARQILGYLPQDPGVYPGTSAEVMLDHFAVLRGLTSRSERREAVERLLHLTNLYEVRKRKLGTYSGGMRRRFGIAQALLGEPELIIVDEPTAGLDPEERNRFHDLLCEIGETAVVILSTHIVEDVRELCSRMAILAKGRVLQQGEPAVLIAGLDGQVWRKLIDRAEVAHYRERMDVLSTRLVGGRVVLHVRSAELPGAGFEPAAADLEHVYFAALNDRSNAA
ncbi:MAG: ABC transporter ATP-binding protein [Gemmatimonadaceae bacterium]|nr:ABC transporter ATP-binding protein [Gemmatimonadaceae bacterium]